MTRAVQGLTKKRKPVVLSTAPVAGRGSGPYLSLYTDLSKICTALPTSKSFSGKGSNCTFRRLRKENVWKVQDHRAGSWYIISSKFPRLVAAPAQRQITKEENLLGRIYFSVHHPSTSYLVITGRSNYRGFLPLKRYSIPHRWCSQSYTAKGETFLLYQVRP